MRARLPLIGLPLLGILGGAGCGDADAVEGTWLRTDFPFNRPCQEELDFTDSTFVTTILCDLKDQQVGIQVTVGKYRKSDNKIYVSPLRSSCRDVSRDEELWTVNVSKGTLTKTVGTATFSFKRGKSPVTNTKITGCFNPELTNHEPSTIEDL